MTDDVPERTAELAHGLSIAQLLSAVENELIPRLLVSHSAELERSPVTPLEAESPPHGPWASHSEVARFAGLSAAGEETALREHVSALLSRGVGLDAIYLHLFAPAARHLGEQWVRDEVSFVDVQFGLCALHRIVCECGPIGFRQEPRGEPRSILLSVAPGDQHTFGVTLAAEFFRRHGWQVSNLAGLETGFVLERVASTSYTAVGFSLHNENCFAALADEIVKVRERTCNSDMLVLVGGDYFARNPATVVEVGADLSASDAHRAVFAAEKALDSMQTAD